MKLNKSDFLKVASISKAHGIKGELFLRPFHSKASWPQNLKNIFIGESLSEFAIKQYKQVKGGWIFSLKTINNRIEAEQFRSKTVFLPKKKFKTKKGESIYLAELKGFLVETLDKKQIGIVHSFQSPASQDVLIVQEKTKKSKILIPFVKAYILKLDFKRKKIVISLPKGYLKFFKPAYKLRD